MVGIGNRTTIRGGREETVESGLRALSWSTDELSSVTWPSAEGSDDSDCNAMAVTVWGESWARLESDNGAVSVWVLTTGSTEGSDCDDVDNSGVACVVSS